MSIDIHCGADVRMAEQFLDIFRCGTGGEEVAGVGVAQDMEMKTAESSFLIERHIIETVSGLSNFPLFLIQTNDSF